MKTSKLCNRIVVKQLCYVVIALILLGQSVYSQPGKSVQPVIGVAPLYVMAMYGLYWGVSISGGIEIMEKHLLSVSADLAPLGLLGMLDVATDGKVQYWGGTISYLFQIELGRKLLRIAPGVALGLSSIPYIYGTFYSDVDATAFTAMMPKSKPERENVWSAGPELRISIGRNRAQFFMDGRGHFARNSNFAFLANLGVSFKL